MLLLLSTLFALACAYFLLQPHFTDADEPLDGSAGPRADQEDRMEQQ